MRRIPISAVMVFALPAHSLDGEVAIHEPSYAASRWWLNGEPVIALNDDRQAVIDDGASRRLTLHKGRNVIRAAIINGGGATDLCARFLDENDRPITDVTASLLPQ